MIHVDLDKILTDTDVAAKISDLISDVQGQKELYVITKQGKPAAAIIDIGYLEELGGSKVIAEEPLETTETKPEPKPQETPASTPASTEPMNEAPLIEEVDTPDEPTGNLIKPKLETDVDDQATPELKPNIPPITPTSSMPASSTPPSQPGLPPAATPPPTPTPPAFANPLQTPPMPSSPTTPPSADPNNPNQL